MSLTAPFDKVLKILGARLSRTNPLAFEVDIGCGVYLGVVTIERVRLRVYLEEPIRPPGIDVPGAIAGRGYLEIGPGGAPGTSTIGGQIDVAIRPISLRAAAAFETLTIIDPNDASRHVTAVYAGLNVVDSGQFQRRQCQCPTRSADLGARSGDQGDREDRIAQGADQTELADRLPGCGAGGAGAVDLSR